MIELYDEIADRARDQFIVKQHEYKTEADCFRNFNQGALLQNESPEQALLGYTVKQIVSLLDAKHVHPERLMDREFVEEKAGDIQVYMHILRMMALVRKRKRDRSEASHGEDQDN